jgi:hypothetical protein
VKTCVPNICFESQRVLRYTEESQQVLALQRQIQQVREGHVAEIEVGLCTLNQVDP